MGRPFLVEYNQTPHQQFFLCRQCRTHIALAKDFLIGNPDPEIPKAIFNNLVNVEVDGEAHYRVVGALTEADIYCVNCGSLLGQKFIHIALEENPIYFRAGKFMLQLNKLLRWTGTEMRYADTDQPVENP